MKTKKLLMLMFGAILACETTLMGCSPAKSEKVSSQQIISYDYDLLIKNGNIYKVGDGLDIAISNGKIVSIEDEINEQKAKKTIDATDKLVSPGFVDTHMHIDKGMIAGDENSNDLMAAINASSNYISSVPKDKIIDDILTRSRQIIDMAIVNGTTALKTNVLISSDWDIKALTAINQLKEEYKDYIDIYNSTPWDENFSDELGKAAENGEINFIAGYPTLTDDYKKSVDDIFNIALKYNLPIDIHVDESDEPNIDCFNYVLDKTIETGMEGKVTCGHVTALSADGLSDDVAAQAISKAVQAKVNITTLSSCNMYLMSEDRRGVTRVKEFLDAGVNIAYASDNIRDPFRPFGNADMLEEALITAQINKFGTTKSLNSVYEMGTYNAAKNALLNDYGIAEGCNADLVILDAPTPSEAIISQSDKLYVLKHGKIVAENGTIIK